MGLKFKVWTEFLLLFPNGKNLYCLIGEGATLATLSFNVSFILILKVGTVISQWVSLALIKMCNEIANYQFILK